MKLLVRFVITREDDPPDRAELASPTSKHDIFSKANQ